MSAPAPRQEAVHPRLQRLIRYVMRERERGRPTHEILKDPYVQAHEQSFVEQARDHVDRAMAMRAL
jgi:hypothetical protein